MKLIVTDTRQAFSLSKANLILTKPWYLIILSQWVSPHNIKMDLCTVSTSNVPIWKNNLQNYVILSAWTKRWYICVCVHVQVSWQHLCRSTQKGDIRQSVHSTEQSLGVIGKPMSPFIAHTRPQTHLQTYTLIIKTFKWHFHDRLFSEFYLFKWISSSLTY